MRFFISSLMIGAAVIGMAQAKPPLPAPTTMTEATAGPSKVAIWKTGDADTTVYMMGTVHILNPGINWKNDAFEAAWAASPVVYLEADVTSPEAMNEVAGMIPTHGVNKPGVTLASFYSADEQKRINDALAPMNVSLEMLAPLRPWLAGVQIANLAIASIGGKAEAGIEMILDAEAKASGKEQRYFETLAEQIVMISSPSDQDQARVFLDGIEDLKNPEDFFAKLVGAWYRGDTGELARIMTDGLSIAPSVADALLYARNENWAATLDTLIQSEPGTFFVAVGAAHLVGEKSVQDYLAERGHMTARVN